MNYSISTNPCRDRWDLYQNYLVVSSIVLIQIQVIPILWVALGVRMSPEENRLAKAFCDFEIFFPMNCGTVIVERICIVCLYTFCFRKNSDIGLYTANAKLLNGKQPEGKILFFPSINHEFWEMNCSGMVYRLLVFTIRIFVHMQ